MILEIKKRRGKTEENQRIKARNRLVLNAKWLTLKEMILHRATSEGENYQEKP